MWKGYKYTRRGDSIYIITLSCFNEYLVPVFTIFPIEFFTTDCVVEKIVNINTNEEVDSIEGRAYYKYKYEKGKRYTGTSIYYCKTRTALGYYFFGRNSKGVICDRSLDTFGFLRECYPGSKGMVYLAVKSCNGDESLLYEKLNAAFLHMEKRLFPDEERTLEEILHVDDLPSGEDIPRELVDKLGAKTRAEAEQKWEEIRQKYRIVKSE